jgi:hypothetical protein
MMCIDLLNIFKYMIEIKTLKKKETAEALFGYSVVIGRQRDCCSRLSKRLSLAFLISIDLSRLDISENNWSADQVLLECFWRLDKQQMNKAQTKLEFRLGTDTFRSIQVFKSFLIYTIKFFHSICLDYVIKKIKNFGLW